MTETARGGSRVESIVHALERDIVTGVLNPGDRLDERGLSERFDVSRTPIREALRQLSAAGLVTTQPRRGAVVASITIGELVEMFEMMAEMESFCARLCARRMLRDELRALEDRLAECRQALAENDPDRYYLSNALFHEVLYRGARNSHLEAYTLHLRNRLAPYRRLQLHRQGRLASSDAEHQRIVDAIRANDEERAAAEMRQHVSAQGQGLTDMIALLPR